MLEDLVADAGRLICLHATTREAFDAQRWAKNPVSGVSLFNEQGR